MKKNIANSKGVTLIALVITVIVLLIIASIATYSGMQIIESSKLNTFTAEMKIMQTQVNNLYDKWQRGEEDINTLGKSLNYNSEVQEQVNEVLKTVLDIQDTTGYRYYDQETIQDLGIEGVKQEFFINVEQREVVSYKGLRYDGDMYYTLIQLPDGLYNVDYNPEEASQPTFDVSYEKTGENKWKIKISNVKSNGYINKWYVRYQLKGQDYWNTSEDLNFVVDKQGIYTIKLYNGDIETTQGKEVFVATDYAKNGLLLHYDAINNTGGGDDKHSTTATTWKDLSGNGNDGELKGFTTNDELSGWKANMLSFNGNTDYVTVNNILKDKTEFTIEVIYKPKRFINYEYIFGIDANKFGYETSSEGKNVLYYVKNFDTSFRPFIELCPNNIEIVNKSNTISIGEGKISSYLNAEKYLNNSLLENDLYTEGNVFAIAAANSSGNYKTQMDCYSFRIYDRVLTDEDVKINYEVDRKRFNLDK